MPFLHCPESTFLLFIQTQFKSPPPQLHPLRPAHLLFLLEVLVARSWPKNSEALAEGMTQPSADDGRTPKDWVLGGYRVAPTATHSESAMPVASPERTPWGQSLGQGREVLCLPNP